MPATIHAYSHTYHHSNQTEIVQTYVTYVQNSTALFLARGARVVISSLTPTNPYLDSSVDDAFAWTPSKFAWYAWYAAAGLGGPDAGVYYVDHEAYAAAALARLGRNTTDAGFPMDNTHTAPFLADVFARAFVLGLKCGTAPLQGFVGNATSRIEGAELGSCLSVNETLPI
jgi:rhamnogalacturonan acetylesterase